MTDSPQEAAALLRAGEVVAFPTETVYGLGANAFEERAVRKIFAAKGRPADNPLIVHLAHLDQIERLAAAVPPSARRLIDAFFPGPLTVILKKKPAVPDVVTGGLDSVGVRMPRHRVAQAFLEACNVPVAAPSANRSGRPSPTTWQAVYADLDGRIAAILRGDRTPAGLESTVVDCTGAAATVLRTGVITLEQLRGILPDIHLADQEARGPARSPGIRYRHYAPRARVRLVDDPAEARPGADAAYIGLAAPAALDAFALHAVCPTVEAYAHELFDFFRRCDAAGLRAIYCQRVAPTGLGRALLDRLLRAAEG